MLCLLNIHFKDAILTQKVEITEIKLKSLGF